MQVIDDRLGLNACRQPGRGAGHVAGKCLFDREQRYWPAFRLIGVKQPRTRVSFDDEGEFPGKIVGLVDAGIPAETAIGRHEVRRIARDEYATVMQLPGDARRRPPATVAVDPHGKISAYSGTHELDESRLTQVSSCVHGCLRIEGRVANDVHTEKPGRGCAIEAKESS